MSKYNNTKLYQPKPQEFNNSNKLTSLLKLFSFQDNFYKANIFSVKKHLQIIYKVNKLFYSKKIINNLQAY